jgi:hypothetical protein
MRYDGRRSVCANRRLPAVSPAQSSKCPWLDRTPIVLRKTRSHTRAGCQTRLLLASRFSLMSATRFATCSGDCFFPSLAVRIFALVASVNFRPVVVGFPILAALIFALVSADITRRRFASDIFARCASENFLPFLAALIFRRASSVCTKPGVPEPPPETLVVLGCKALRLHIQNFSRATQSATGETISITRISENAPHSIIFAETGLLGCLFASRLCSLRRASGLEMVLPQ